MRHSRYVAILTALLSLTFLLIAGMVGEASAAKCGKPASITVPVTDADGAYTVAWGASATATVTYVLEEATNSTFTTGKRTVYTGAGRQASIAGRAKGKTYYYRVKAKRTGYTTSAWRIGSMGCAVPGTSTCGKPVSITFPATDEDGSYTVAWGASATTGVTYILEEATNITFTTGKRTVYNGTGKQVDVTGRVQGKTYYYRVKARKAGRKDSAWRKGAAGCVIAMADFEQVRVAVLHVIEEDSGAQGTTPLSPAEYQSIADKIATIPGVEVVDYVGDTLGTIEIKVVSGGTMVWRHIKQDFTTEGANLPEDANFDGMLNPVWNSDWRDPVTPAESNTFATHFPLATSNPDPEYTSDQAVDCPNEGKVAIVDFMWTDASANTTLYDEQFMVDGVMLYDRMRMMAEAAGFTVDIYHDDQINVGNVSQLQNYKIVYLIAHGGRPGPKTTERLGHALSLLYTPELYAPEKLAEGGATYEQLWKDGDIIFNVDTKTIAWTSWFLRDYYKPAAEQLVMSNQCWGMLPYNTGLYKDENGDYVWHKDMTREVYNLGNGFMDAGVKVVMGYITPADPHAVVVNTMSFLRRLFGGYYSGDVPPSRFGMSYWPTCMSAQTYFRLPQTPEYAIYAPKYIAPSNLYTMYAVPQAQYFRDVCTQNPNRHSSMQAFMLKVGTPATALPLCWDTYWSHGNYPSGIVDPLCSQGDNPTTQAATEDAACAVKDARQVTNAILSTTP